MQPELTEKNVLAAIREFDSSLRDTEDWTGWEGNKAHRYAILYESRLYPVKKIASLASGVAVTKFSGGRYPGHANELLKKVGFKVVPLRGTNPDWTRDELILALDVYLRHRPNPPGKESKDIIELSKTLQRLGELLFPPWERADSFRNANGVYMKLMNFRRLDPEYTSDGRKGLTAGAKGEEEVWEQFASDPAQCRKVAEAIVVCLNDDESSDPEIADVDDGFQEAPEGRLLTRKHLSRERSRKLVNAKHRQVLRTLGKLECEACGFNFASKYGLRGEGFIECHHTKPVATLGDGERTHINDLALVCANCHRMIHRSKQWLTMVDLKRLITLAAEAKSM